MSSLTFGHKRVDTDRLLDDLHAIPGVLVEEEPPDGMREYFKDKPYRRSLVSLSVNEAAETVTLVFDDAMAAETVAAIWRTIAEHTTSTESRQSGGGPPREA